MSPDVAAFLRSLNAGAQLPEPLQIVVDAINANGDSE